MLSVEDYRQVARRRLPRLVFDYVDGGAETESTVRGNRRGVRVRDAPPPGGMDPTGIDIGVSVLGTDLAMPHPAGALRHGTRGRLERRSWRAPAPPGGPGRCSSSRRCPAIRSRTSSLLPTASPVWYQLYRVGPRSPGRSRHRPRPRGRGHGPRRHVRHLGRIAPRTRPPKRRPRASSAPACCAPCPGLPAPDDVTAMAARPPPPRSAAEADERHHGGRHPAGHRTRADHGRAHLGGPALDP